jgi:chemotaxis protein MotB
MTLLLALFIVLFSMSSVDAKRFDEMSRAFNMALDGGVGVLDNFRSVQTGKDLNDEKEREKSKQEQKQQTVTKTQQQQQQDDLEKLRKKEQEDLEKLKKQLDQY